MSSCFSFEASASVYTCCKDGPLMKRLIRELHSASPLLHEQNILRPQGGYASTNPDASRGHEG